jgi:hypothetical protein
MRSILLLLCILCVTGFANAQTQTARTFTKGSYYDTMGTKYTGFLRLKVPNKGILDFNHFGFLFQQTEAVPEKEISINQVKSFTIGVDSFVVTHNPNLEKAPVLKVLLNTAIKLYYSEFYNRGNMLTANFNAAINGSGIYFYGPDPDNLQFINRKNFKEALSQVMEAKPNVVANIQNDNFTYGYMDDLIKYYKVR